MSDYTEVFYYYPQLIGYTRVILLFVSLLFINTSPITFLFIYVISFGLDVLDGPVARAYGQTSHFGAMLDMITDKFSTPALCLTLSNKYNSYAVIFTGVLTLDIVSHYFHIQETLLSGRVHHKTIESGKSIFLRLYYNNGYFFGITCLGYEGFLVFLYAFYFTSEGTALYLFLKWCVFLSAPLFCTKIIVHIVQLHSACEGIAKIDYAQKQRFRRALLQMVNLFIW